MGTRKRSAALVLATSALLALLLLGPAVSPASAGVRKLITGVSNVYSNHAKAFDDVRLPQRSMPVQQGARIRLCPFAFTT